MNSLSSFLNNEILGYAREWAYWSLGAVRRHSPQEKFVVFGRGRSGSTLLVDLINEHPKVHCVGEILNRKVFSPAGMIMSCSRMQAEPVFGFKLLSYQLRSVLGVDPPKELLRRLVEEDGFKMIYLTRENLLRQTLSKHYAAHRGGWHVRTEKVKRSKMTVNIPLLIQHLKEGETLGKFEKEMIADLDHLSLTYERNLSDEIAQGQTINALCNLLGIEAIQASSKLKKIAPRSFDEFIENAEEMVRAIEKTPFGIYLNF